MIWVKAHKLESGEQVYNFVDENGNFQISAVEGYPPLDEYLQTLEEESN